MQEKVALLKANLLKSMGHPTRIRILELLKDEEHCVCDIFEELEMEQANVSQHLAVLKKQDILDNRKEGLRVIYRIKYPEIVQVLEIVDQILVSQANDTMATMKSMKA